MFKLSLQTQIILGMVLGIFCGLFFGELCAPLEKVGDVFIMLLKMTILPFMASALIHAIGSLSPGAARTLLRKGVVFFLLFWTLTLVIIFSMTLAFPSMEAPMYHAQVGGGEDSSVNLLNLFIPVNPFHALANNIIPAVVLFSIFFGTALMQIENKGHLLQTLDTVNQTLIHITKTVNLLAPLGVFSLVAASTGTLPFHHLAKIQVYVLSYIGAALFASFMVFPSLVSLFTPIRRREFLAAIRPALLIGFTTGNNLVALPYLISGLKELGQTHKLEEKAASQTIGSMIPIAYNFPTAGNLLSLLFILFLSFFYGISLSVLQHLQLIAFGLPALFGAAPASINAVAFLIEKMQLPSDGFSMFLETMPITRNFQALISSVGMATVTLIVTFSCLNRSIFRIRQALKNGLRSLLVGACGLFAIFMVTPEPTSAPPIFTQLSLEQTVPSKRHSMAPLKGEAGNQEDALERIRRTGVIRVGYNLDAAPFSYLNAKEELVGYDIAVAHSLAASLECAIEFVPFQYAELTQALVDSQFDIAMSAVSVSTERLKVLAFTRPYTHQERVFAVPDSQQKHFSQTKELQKEHGLSLAVQRGSSLEPILKKAFKKATIIPIDHTSEFHLDDIAQGLFWTQAEATNWALIHPLFAVAHPKPSLGQEHYAYALNAHSPQLVEFVNYWIELKEADGFFDELHERWVLGKVNTHERRWSFAQDVLHWFL